MKKGLTPSAKHEDRPPILGTWRRFYWVVLILHAILILLFYFITQWYS